MQLALAPEIAIKCRLENATECTIDGRKLQQIMSTLNLQHFIANPFLRPRISAGSDEFKTVTEVPIQLLTPLCQMAIVSYNKHPSLTHPTCFGNFRELPQNAYRVIKIEKRDTHLLSLAM